MDKSCVNCVNQVACVKYVTCVKCVNEVTCVNQVACVKDVNRRKWSILGIWAGGGPFSQIPQDSNFIPLEAVAPPVVKGLVHRYDLCLERIDALLA